MDKPKFRYKFFILSTLLLIAFLALPTYADDEVAIMEQTIFEEQGIKITAVSMSSDDDETIINIQLTNNTNGTLSFKTEKSSINDMMIDFRLNEEVPANDSKDTQINIFSPELDLQGISLPVQKIDMAFHISSSDGSIDISTPVQSLHTTAYKDSSQPDFGTALLDQNGIQIYQGDFSSNDFGAFQYLTVTNSTTKSIHAYADNEIFNDVSMSDHLDFGDIEPGKSSVVTLGLGVKDLKNHGINNIASAGATFRFLDYETGDVILEKDISVKIGDVTSSDSSGSEIYTTMQISDETAFTDDYVQITFSNLQVDSLKPSSFNMSIHNISSKELYYDFDSALVNAYKINGCNSGSSTLNLDYMVSIEPGDIYNTTVWLSADGLREQQIHEIKSISLNLAFFVSGGVHKISADVPLVSNSVSTKLAETISQNANDYDYKVYHFTSSDYFNVLYEIHNPNSVDVSVKGTLKFKDNSGNVVDTQTDELQCVYADKYNMLVFQSPHKDIDSISLSIAAEEVSAQQESSTSFNTENLGNGKIKVTISNPSDKPAIVQCLTLYLKNNQLTGFTRGLGGRYQKVPAFQTETFTLNNPGMGFDDYHFFASALNE